MNTKTLIPFAVVALFIFVVVQGVFSSAKETTKTQITAGKLFSNEFDKPQPKLAPANVAKAPEKNKSSNQKKKSSKEKKKSSVKSFLQSSIAGKKRNKVRKSFKVKSEISEEKFIQVVDGFYKVLSKRQFYNLPRFFDGEFFKTVDKKEWISKFEAEQKQLRGRYLRRRLVSSKEKLYNEKKYHILTYEVTYTDDNTTETFIFNKLSKSRRNKPVILRHKIASNFF